MDGPEYIDRSDIAPEPRNEYERGFVDAMAVALELFRDLGEPDGKLHSGFMVTCEVVARRFMFNGGVASPRDLMKYRSEVGRRFRSFAVCPQSTAYHHNKKSDCLA